MRGALGRGDRLGSGRGAGDRMCKHRRQVAVVAADRCRCLCPAGPDTGGRAGEVAGSCDANFGIPAAKVTVHVGQDIDVHMTEESTGYYGTHFVPMFPLPCSSRPSVLARTTISTDKATGTFTARHPGHAVLFTTADCLDSTSQRETHGKCPALDITVLP